jgi:hypothetical protein
MSACRSSWRRGAACALLCAVLVAAPASRAFTFSDGTTAQCIVNSQAIPEINAPPEHEFSKLGRTGMTVTSGSQYMIIWNTKMLGELPPAIHDLLFFHECAHAQIPTKDELKANCAGLKAMRAANRAGFAVEAELAKFYGPTSGYWAETLKCANAAAKEGGK